MGTARGPAFSTVTSTALLAGLADPANRTVWEQFVERYRPLLVRYACRVGLSPEDAEDVAQASLLAFSTDFREGVYDRSLGRLRSWLFGIVQNRVRSFRRGAGAREVAAVVHGGQQGP